MKLMKKNIMLLFLSVMKKYDENSKEAEYYGYAEESLEKIDLGKCTQTNEAPVKYILSILGKSEKLDEIYVLTTHTAKDLPVYLEKGTDYFFRKRIEEFCEKSNLHMPQIIPIEYNEKTDLPFSTIISMMEQIKKNEYTNGANIYVDMTGGLRNATMLLISITKLLQYSGFEMKKVIYSNVTTQRIEDATPIYSLYDLISGAGEFVQYGSVSGLLDYYKDKPKSPKLEKLLDEMNRFSQNLRAIKDKYRGI